jgi:carboxymethylenebutenolidase
LPRILTSVTPLQRYIAEEIAADHVDGLLTRREAVRRLALLGVGTAAATALIAACSVQQKPADASSPAPEASSQPPGMTTALPTEPITWPGPQGRFGGGLVWQLLSAGALAVSAAVPFYGPLPENPDFAGAKAAVLGIYAALDIRVTGSESAARAALDRAGLVNDLIVEPNADHAFFNDTGPRYNPAAAADAWQRMLDWFGRYLAG